jgi:uncharacterized protein (TIRG00374 family)
MIEPSTSPAGGALRPAASGNRYRNAVISIAASGLLLAILYRSLDLPLVAQALFEADRLWMIVAVAAILPITVLRAARFFWVAPAGALPGFAEALRLTLVASTLNLFAPAKAGDLVKGYIVATRSDTSPGVSLSLVVFERLCDLLGLVSWCVLGYVIARPRVVLVPAFWAVLGVGAAACALLVLSDAVAGAIRKLAAAKRPGGRFGAVLALVEGWPDLLRLLHRRRKWIVLLSAALWLGHLSQIWLFTVALAAEVPFWVSASLSAVALMAGQLPFTLAGIGARDLALVVLMANYMAPETAAAMGILIATRGLVPALLGLPLTWPYLSSMLGHARRWRRRHRARVLERPAD